MSETKTFLVTGAGKGIGRATAQTLAEAGFTVFAGARSDADLADLGRAHRNIHPLRLDISRAEDISAAVRAIHAITNRHGLDGLVNNAGIAVPAPLEFVPTDDFRAQIDINLTAQLMITQALLPDLRAARGRIVNVTSIGGRIAGTMLGAYHASKFALEALTDTLRQELAPAGIRVIAIEPGEIATPMWDSGARTFDNLLGRMPPQVMEYYSDSISKAQAQAKVARTNGTPPERVAEIILRALTTPRPRTRYTAGTDAWIADTLIRRLPDRWRDRLMAAR